MVEARLVRLADGPAGLHLAPGHPQSVSVDVMIAARLARFANLAHGSTPAAMLDYIETGPIALLA
jgi:hypothetical protein